MNRAVAHPQSSSSSSSSSTPLCVSIPSGLWGLVFLAACAWPGEPERSAALDGAARRQILKLIEQLGAEDYRTREAAQAALEDAPPVALPLLKEYENSDDPEVRLRIREIIPRARESPRRMEKELRERLKRDGVKFRHLAVDERKLVTLDLAGTDIADLAPLKGIPLAALQLADTKVTDLSPLAGMPLEKLTAPLTITEGFDALGRIPTLKAISGVPVEQFSLECLARKTFGDAGVTWRTFELCDDGRCILSFGPEAAANLAGLRGLPVKHLDFRDCKWLADLAPLRGLPLDGLNLQNTSVDDVGPLAGMPLTNLILSDTGVADLRPLAGLRLTYLSMYRAPVADIAPLRGLPLKTLILTHTQVADLRPLRGMPLRSLHIEGTKVTDLTPLQGMQLTELFFSPERIKAGIEVIRNMATIRCLGGGAVSTHFIAAAEFWARHDARPRQPR